jgi:hypothetical protein
MTLTLKMTLALFDEIGLPTNNAAQTQDTIFYTHNTIVIMSLCLLHINKVLHLNLKPKTSYLEYFHGYLLFLHANTSILS